MASLTDLAYVRSLCAKYEFSLSKTFGQNFIVNAGIPPRMAQAAGAGPGMGVLEIGPGFGVLTHELARRADKVVALEVDRRLLPVLAETLADMPNAKVILQDALTADLPALLHAEFGAMPVAVCANLPYNITSPILMRLLTARLPVENITVMVQKEAADRITAAPGTRASGAISCAVAYYTRAETLFSVQPGSFYPPPKVTSAVIRLEPGVAGLVAPAREEAFFALVRAAFGQRRKTAANAIAAGLALPKAAVLQALAAAGLPPAARPEQLALPAFARLLDEIDKVRPV